MLGVSTVLATSVTDVYYFCHISVIITVTISYSDGKSAQFSYFSYIRKSTDTTQKCYRNKKYLVL